MNNNYICQRCKENKEKELKERFGAFSIGAAVWKPRYCSGKNCPRLIGVS